MSTTSRPRRPRTTVGTLVFSTNKATKNTIRAMKRIDKEVQMCFNPINFKVTNYKFVTT